LILILLNIGSFVLVLVKYIDIEVGPCNNRFYRYFLGQKITYSTYYKGQIQYESILQGIEQNNKEKKEKVIYL